MKRLVLLGAGANHLQVLRQLAREPLPGVRVAMVAPQPQVVLPVALPALVAGECHLSDVTIDARALAEAARVEWVAGQAAACDPVQRVLHLADGRRAEYDALSLDDTEVIDREALPGAREHGLFVQPAAHCARLFDGVLELAAQRPLDVVVMGATVLAAELALALQGRLAGGQGFDARVSWVSGGEPVLPGQPPAATQRLLGQCRRRHIPLLTECVTSVERHHVVLANGARLACDVPVLAMPSKMPPWVRDLVGSSGEATAQVPVQTLQLPAHPEVFAAPAPYWPDARLGQALALNLRRFLAGGELKPCDPRPATPPLRFGAGRAVATMGPLVVGGRWAAGRARRLLRRSHDALRPAST